MMNPNQKKAALMAAAATALLLFASALRFFCTHDSMLLAEAQLALIYPIYVGMIVAWGVSISRRIMQRNVLFCLLATASCMLLWVMTRTIRYKVTPLFPEANRILWYCYYIPMLLMPLLGFFAALCLGNDESRRPEKRHLLLLIPAVLLIGGILTNDLHQWAFDLRPDTWHRASKYTHDFLYFIAAGWILLFELLTVLTLERKSRMLGTRKRIWMPFAIMGVGVLYTLLYIYDRSMGGVRFIEMTAMLCFLKACVWESCIQIGMIPSNTGYDVLFHRSELSVQILDEGGQVRYAAARAVPVDRQSLALLKDRGVLQPDENTELHAAPIRGGQVVWREDVSRIAGLNRRLAENRQRLSEGNYLMRREIEAKSEALRVEEQTRLYELISQKTRPQLMAIEKRLDAAERGDEQVRRRLLCEINVLGAYIKRRGNLLLMAEEQQAVSAGELRLCLTESLENLKLCGVKGGAALGKLAEIPASFAALCYDLFEEAIELDLPALTGMFTALVRQEGELFFTVQAKYGAGTPPAPWEGWETARVSGLGCRITWEAEDDGLMTVTLSLPEGGAAI